MSKRAHGIRGTWPLYLVIAIAGFASIATSLPWWSEYRQFEGPTVALGPDRREDAVPFTVRFSPKYASTDISVFGTVDYEDADEELRIALVDPDQRTLATQFHTIQGDGRLTFRLVAQATSLRCASPETDTCEQKLAVVFGTGGTRTGAYVIDWFLTLEMRGEASEPPADLIFEVDFDRGRVVQFTPGDDSLTIPPDAPADDRWRVVTSFFLDPDNAGNSVHLTMAGNGPYTASQLYIPLTISYQDYSPQDEATFRIVVVPDEPGGEAVEHVAKVSGSGHMQVALSIPEPLDCVDEIACERGFTITLDGEAEIIRSLYVDIFAQAAIDGDGEVAPANAWVTLTQTPGPAQPQND